MADVSLSFVGKDVKTGGENHRFAYFFLYMLICIFFVKSRFFNNSMFLEKKNVQIVNDTGGKMHKFRT